MSNGTQPQVFSPISQPGIRPTPTFLHAVTTVPQAIPSAPGIPDAPFDGQIYGRQDGAWTAVTAEILVGPTEQMVLPPPWVPPTNVIYWRTLLGGSLVQVGGSLNYGSPFNNGLIITMLPLPSPVAGGAFNHGICTAATGSSALQYAIVFLAPDANLLVYNPSGLAQLIYLNNLFDLTL